MSYKVLSHFPKHYMQQVKELPSSPSLSCTGSFCLTVLLLDSMKTHLFVHDELHLQSPKFAMCFRSSVLLSCNSGFPVAIWKCRGISAVWNSSQQTLFRQLMIPQSLSVPVSSLSCKQSFSSASWIKGPNSPLIYILWWGWGGYLQPKALASVIFGILLTVPLRNA